MTGCTDPAVIVLLPYGQTPVGAFCKKHPSQKYTGLCISCSDELTCSECVCEGGHSSHFSDVLRLADTAAASRAAIATELEAPPPPHAMFPAHPAPASAHDPRPVYAMHSFVDAARSRAQRAEAAREAHVRSATEAKAAVDRLRDTLMAAVYDRCGSLGEMASDIQRTLAAVLTDTGRMVRTLDDQYGYALDVLSCKAVLTHPPDLAARLAAVRRATLELTLASPSIVEVRSVDVSDVLAAILCVGEVVTTMATARAVGATAAPSSAPKPKSPLDIALEPSISASDIEPILQAPLVRAVAARCRVLLAELEPLLESKAAALLAEQRAADDALQLAETAEHEAREALRVLCDADIVVQARCIAAQLQAVRGAIWEQCLQPLQTVDITVRVDTAAAALAAQIRGLGEVHTMTAQLVSDRDVLRAAVPGWMSEHSPSSFDAARAHKQIPASAPQSVTLLSS